MISHRLTASQSRIDNREAARLGMTAKEYRERGRPKTLRRKTKHPMAIANRRPWIVDGISRRTWFRRRAEARDERSPMDKRSPQNAAVRTAAKPTDKS